MEGRIRLDKWLWQARFLKSRSLAAALIEAGHVRLNGAHVMKPAHAVGPGDVLTFALNREIRVVRVLSCGTRRGPATEARTLYAEAGGTSDPAEPSPGE
ncbi:RNA-binding S4 domain-containing protein [Frigidibacter sp. RF13]|uniref:RNA-binding S4 domain-containing protein n=1 Tax=Frigidibacter sp. RF13 TaxID=2997340 RepID=UPI00226E1E83|nr:RNA-binding S4 domain-containing protein [Frigidibacter sp. RF13]MCY1125781.1 RNA-binding S4 domain-containing protein [Frigidibacter sp. RF13]